MKTSNVVTNRKRRALLAATLIVLILLPGALAGCSSADSKVLTHNLSEPLGGAQTAKFDINTDTGNLTIDTLTGGEPVLASGTLEYLENQGQPTRTMTKSNGQT